MISLLTDVEKVLQLSMLNARIKSSHLSNFMSYDRFWFVFSFHNHWKILVNNIHRSNVLRNTEIPVYADYERKQQPATKKSLKDVQRL